jgi:WD40 repeat protein/serine/threonine protein kinase
MLQGRYRIVSLLGKGGMGSVYRAWDTRLNVPVALKEMIPQPGLDADMLSRLRSQFRQEAEVLARLSHPNLVGVLDFFEEGGNAYLVMKYIEGVSLATLIVQEGPLPESQVLEWARQLLEALTYCHDRGIIHRDLKPHNVIITPEGQAILVDFGLVKLWDPNDPKTHTVMRGAGTPGYAPPEQYVSDGGHTDQRSDLYSLGATLYHALTGQAPPSVNERIANPERFRSPRQLNPEVSERVEAAVLRAMRLSRNERVRDTGELATNLFGQGPVVSSKGKKSEYEQTEVIKAKSPRKRMRMPGWLLGVGCVGLIFVILLAVTAMGAALGWSDLFWPSPTDLAETPDVTKDVEPVETPTEEGDLVVTPTLEIPTASPAPASPLLSLPPYPVFSGMALPRSSVSISPDNVGDIKAWAIWGSGIPTRVDWSSDGKLLAVGSTVGVWIYDVSTMDLVSFIETKNYVLSVAFSPDNAFLATTEDSYRGSLHVWRLSDMELVSSIEMEYGEVGIDIDFSPDGQILAVGVETGMVYLWKVDNGKLLETMEGHLESVSGLAFSPDGLTLASSSADGTIRVWQVPDGEELQKLAGGVGMVSDVAFSPDGKVLAASGEDGAVQLWDVAEGTLVNAFEDNDDIGSSVAFSADGSLVAAGTENGAVWVWQVSDGKVLHTFENHTGAVLDVSFLPVGGALLSTSLDGTIRLWGLADGSEIQSMGGYLGAMDLAFSYNERFLYAKLGEYEGSIAVIKTADGMPESGLGTYDGRVAFSSDGLIVAFEIDYGEVEVWDLSDEVLIRKFDVNSYIDCMALSGDGGILAIGVDQTMSLWQISDGALLAELVEDVGDSIDAMAFSPDGTYLAASPYSDQNVIHLWRVSDGVLVHTLSGHELSVTDLAFSSDGTLLASVSFDASVLLWQVSDGTLLYALDTDSYESKYSVTFSPDGQLVVAGGDDAQIYLWRVSDGTLLRKLEGHTEKVESLTFSLDGEYLVSSSLDGTVRLWAVED